jgi:hypothetical protein
MLLPSEKQFYVINGPVLSSPESFIDALETKKITKASFDYHIKNGDFSKWVDEVLENPSLAQKISKLKSQKGILKKLKETYN